jgi:hypothetical protein
MPAAAEAVKRRLASPSRMGETHVREEGIGHVDVCRRLDFAHRGGGNLKGNAAVAVVGAPPEGSQ